MGLGRDHAFISPASTNQSDHSNTAVIPTDNLTVCDVIDSLAVNGTESTGVTSFVQESCERVDVLPLVKSVNLNPGKAQLTQDLLDYFSRPRQIASGLIPLTRTNFLAVSPSSQIILATWFTDGFRRLLGAFGWRATVNYHLQITATPFHAGLISMSAQYGIVSGGAALLASRPETSTNCHHTKLDLAESTMAQLSVPFMMDVEFSPTSAAYGTNPMNTPWHGFGLNMLTPSILPAGLSQARYNLFVSLSDIQLFGAGNPSSSTIVPQSGKALKSSPKNAEFENDAYPMSSGLHAASRSLSFFSRAVPLLSSIGGTPVWALEKAAGVLRYFGYAKPTIQDPVVKMNAIYSSAEQNVDQPFAGLVVGPFASQDFGVGAKFSGSDVDEMAIKYVATRWSQACVVELRTTDAVNRTIYAANNNPASFWFRTPLYSATAASMNYGPATGTVYTTDTNSFQPTSLNFVSNCFANWRGGIRYRFTFVKTKMHAGRVMASFFPQTPALSIDSVFWIPPTSPTVPGPEVTGGNLQPFGYTAIFDLKDGNVFEFEVPFMAQSTWLDWGVSSGVVALSVLDPLIASSVVGTSIWINVEVAGGNDIEFAVPVTPRYAPSERGTIYVQSGKVLSTVVPDNDQYTIGNSITSLKQLIMIPHSYSVNSVSANTDWIFTVLPWFFRPTQSTAVPAPNALPIGSFTFGGYVASAYAFARGGTDVHVYASNIANMQLIGWQTSTYGNVDTVSTTLVSSPPVSATPRVWCSPDGPVHYRYPLFMTVGRLFSNLFNGIVWDPSGATTVRNPNMTGLTFMATPTTWNRFSIQNRQSGQSQPVYVNRNAAEDAACAVYQGPTPLAQVTPGGTGLYDTTSNPWMYQNTTPVPTTLPAPVSAVSEPPAAAAPVSAFSSAQESIIRKIVLSEAFPDGGITAIVNREVSAMAPPPSPSVARTLARTSSKSSILQPHTL